ncbi:hypothetical protein [Legionella massiliensis]|nr:hypothetical protein [Legionella massiliensis]
MSIYYEMGVAQALGKETIVIKSELAANSGSRAKDRRFCRHLKLIFSVF